MIARAQLVAVVPAMVQSEDASAPAILGRPGHQVLVQRTDDELVVCPVGDSFQVRADDAIRFPAPWPHQRHRGSWAVAPDLTMAAFAGVHALRAVDDSGTTRWEIRHSCWEGSCLEVHQSYEDYADRPDHRYPKSGSAAFSADGELVWAHVPEPVRNLGSSRGDAGSGEEWLVIRARDGQILTRVDAEAAAEGSDHLPHPTDASQMGLSIGQGQDGPLTRWGRWDGTSLDVKYIEDDMVPFVVSPSGGWVMSVSHDQATLSIRRTYGALRPDSLNLDCVSVDGNPSATWNWAGGFLNETNIIASSARSGPWLGETGHWLVDNLGRSLPARIDYPFQVTGRPTAIGGNHWYTVPEASDALQIWTVPFSGDEQAHLDDDLDPLNQP